MDSGLFCKYCGEKIRPKSNFCEGCGKSLIEDEEDEEDEESESLDMSISDYPKRILEILIIANIISIMWSTYINWGYFYIHNTWINLGITSTLSLVNIFFLRGLYSEKIGAFYGLVGIAILSFLLRLNGFIHFPLVILSIAGALIFYIIIFWLGYYEKK